MNKYVDVVSFNQYIGWYRDVNDAPKMKWEIPYDKPVIISEFGGGAKAGYHGEKNQRWTEEFQENLYRENIGMIDKIEGLSGTTPWILKDCAARHSAILQPQRTRERCRREEKSLLCIAGMV